MQNVLDHLKDRRLNTNLHHVWVSEELRCATFPSWNLSGQLVGYQRYRPDASKERKNDPREGRYFTRVKDKRVGVWGLESWYLSNTLFLTEGIFDACAFTSNNASAIAVLSYDVSDSTRSWLSTVRKVRPVVAVCDNDDSGRVLGRLADVSVTVEGYTDAGEAPNEYIKSLIKEHTSQIL